jgi:AraC-like DNA-binding protein
MHKHHSLKLCFSLKNSFSLYTKKKNFLQVKNIAVNSNVEHKLIGEEGIQLLILFEAESSYSDALKNIIMSDVESLGFPDSFYLNLKRKIEKPSCNMNQIVAEIFEELKIKNLSNKKIDLRIQKIIEIIEKNEEKKMLIRELSESVSLSDSRLQHLFKEQMGVSIKRYLLWKRMSDALHIIIKGKDFTFAAHEAGFADSSHLSRAFKEHFGIKLSDIFKNSRSVQVFVEDK